MTDFSTLLQHGAGNAWLFIPSAILLGALHGLEPGHSKTMMAAFIVAIRGTVGQAVMLGLAATISHTAVVWLVAMVGMYFGSQWNAETTEPYFQLASSALIIIIALWMAWRTWRQSTAKVAHDHEQHAHGHDETKWVDTGHGTIRVEIFEAGMPPRFRLYEEKHHGPNWQACNVHMHTTRGEGNVQEFSFVQREGFLESVDVIPEPHEFTARLCLAHGGHDHHYDLVFEEHAHDHAHATVAGGLVVGDPGYQDQHELAHANDIKQRFRNRDVTNSQIVMFGITAACFKTGTDSPVNIDSSTVRLDASNSDMSAGIRSPSESRTMSPHTSSRPEILIVFPSRMTSACGPDSSRSALSEFSARLCCTNVMPMTTNTNPSNIIASCRFPRTR